MTMDEGQSSLGGAEGGLDVANRLDRIDASLVDGLQEDARFASGIPAHMRSSDLEFIQMTGLMHREERMPAATSDPAPDSPDTDTSRPLSFYEEGVDDVDPSMAPESDGHLSPDDAEMAADVYAPTVAAGIRDLLAEMTPEDLDAPQESEALAESPASDLAESDLGGMPGFGAPPEAAASFAELERLVESLSPEPAEEARNETPEPAAPDTPIAESAPEEIADEWSVFVERLSADTAAPAPETPEETFESMAARLAEELGADGPQDPVTALADWTELSGAEAAETIDAAEIDAAAPAPETSEESFDSMAARLAEELGADGPQDPITALADWTELSEAEAIDAAEIDAAAPAPETPEETFESMAARLAEALGAYDATEEEAESSEPSHAPGWRDYSWDAPTQVDDREDEREEAAASNLDPILIDLPDVSQPSMETIALPESESDADSESEPATFVVDQRAQFESLLAEVRRDILGEIGEIKADLSTLASTQHETVAAVESLHRTEPEFAPPVRRHGPPPELAEAERLVQELQEQPREVKEGKPAEESGQGAAEPPAAEGVRLDIEAFLAEYAGQAPPSVADEEENDATVYTQPDPARRHRSKHGKTYRRMRRAGIILAFALLGALSARYAYHFWKVEFASPATLYGEAVAYEQAGAMLDAVDAYDRFATRYPADAQAAEAKFKAGFLLQLVSNNPTHSQLSEAMSHFNQFLERYPEEARVVRVKSLLGMIQYRLGNYDAAIAILNDPELRLRDQDAALPVWRTLAQSYRKKGEIEKARTAYLTAASLSGNFNADEDYTELSGMYEALATDEKTAPDQRAAYYRDAIKFLSNAMRSPGRDGSDVALKRRLEFLAEKSEQPLEAVIAPEVMEQLELGEPAPGAPAPVATEPAVEPAAPADALQ